MNYQAAANSDHEQTLMKLPGWSTIKRTETPETVAFRSGAALMVLDQLLKDQTLAVPKTLLGHHLALKAATATSKLEGRLAREADIRDAYHLTQTGEARGPDGDLLAFWRDALRTGFGTNHFSAEQDVEGWLQDGTERAQELGPLAACVSVMAAVLDADDRAERVACLLSDAVLARVLNWDVILPVTAQCLTKRMLRDLIAQGEGAEVAVQARILQGIEYTIQRAQHLAQRAAALRAIAPKLRAKGSEAAVALFLSEDAVAPSTMLSPIIQGSVVAMTDRAARRLCDRLVALGVAHELTGRPTFRLYGITP